MYKLYIKDIGDRLFSVLGMLLLGPIYIIIIVLLIIFQKNVFFRQKRIGKNNKVIHIIKFKTMNDKKDLNGNLLEDSKRLTKVGKFLRKSSLDELPQLYNVLKGDMSLVGPRPLLIQYLTLYNEEQIKRHNVKPGITGWAQINGRNAISWEEKFKLDVWYINNISFLLDLKILILTFKKVLIKEGVNQNSNTTMEAFNGNN